MLFLPACESVGSEGSLGMGIVGGVLLALGLGWLALKVLGIAIKTVIVGIILFVLLVIGLLTWGLTSMG
ncbi:MAG: hypothetical protein ACLFUB_06260 [Cyclobacteriaceae bacterium]